MCPYYGHLEVERARFLRKGLVILTDCGQTPVLCLCAENFWYEAAQDSAQPSGTRGTLPPGASCQQSTLAAALQGPGQREKALSC